jgi:hypothetical protein
VKKLCVDKNILKSMYLYKRHSEDEISKRFHCSQWVISNRLRSFGIKTRLKTCNLTHRKYRYNSNFLENINPDIAWILGLLVSDGFIRKNNLSGYFGLKLKREDEDVVLKVKAILEYSGPIYRGRRRLEHKGIIKEFDFSLIQINDVKVVDRLTQIGIRQNKTLNENFLECIKATNQQDVISSFIRGIFDGDGSVLYDHKRKSACFQVVGTCQLMQEVQNYLMSYCHLDKTKLTQNILGTNHYALRYRGNVQIIRILDWVYRYSSHSNRMDRKFDKYREIRRFIGK